jgi:hypothetical protein
MLPEAQLWTHVIIQAIRDSKAPALSKAPIARRYAKQWLSSSNEAVGSFVWACQLINTDPDFIRSAVMKSGKSGGRLKSSMLISPDGLVQVAKK